eukprot:CAMPEP_0184288060 /NCGR_PEP_ID=MMETSP1049-20130417/550_1 /TAXON_ID=77928 /ORGANISM="Proteomonas sulcata, Strain CCMP704" /LENGTH=30 /DNA_ID= /DNA_START= /DNA_END= /DNA_ORIENTATION=
MENGAWTAQPFTPRQLVALCLRPVPQPNLG